MSSNLNIIFIKAKDSSKTVDSSELSSDTETNEILDVSKDNLKTSQIPQKGKIATTEYFSPKQIIVEKRARFFSENIENIKFNKMFISPKIKQIKNNLRKYAEEEMNNIKRRKFSFI